MTYHIDPQKLDWPFYFKRWKESGLSFVAFFHDVLREQYPWLSLKDAVIGMWPFESHKPRQEERLPEPIYPPCRFSNYGNVQVFVLTDLSVDAEALPLGMTTVALGGQS